MTGPHSNDSTPRADGPDAVRDPHGEPLSAMMDGTLSEDESRFLLRRMQHDAELAGRWERWQFYGDAMRGCAGRALPADFNRRIALAIAAEGHGTADDADDVAGEGYLALDAVAGDPRGRGPAATQSDAPAARRPLLRWGGGAALAASVAIAAIVGLRPDASFSPDGGSPAPGTALVDTEPTGAGVDSSIPASASAEPAPLLAAPSDAPSATVATVATSGDEASGAVRTDPVRAVSASAPTALASAPQSAPGQAPRPLPADAIDPQPADASPRVLAAQPLEAGAAPRVPDLRAGFGSDTTGDEVPLIAKPWPRSPLLQGGVDGGVMVDYGQGGDGRGLILRRQAPPPRSESPLLSPPIFAPRSAAPAPASASDAGSDAPGDAPP